MSPILIEIVTSDNDKFGYIGKVDGIEYPTRSEALEANPNNWARGLVKQPSQVKLLYKIVSQE